MRTVKTALLALVAFALAAGPALAAERPDGDPKGTIEAIYKAIEKLASESESQDQIVAGLTGEMDKLVDYTAFSERTLKGTWEDLSEENRTRFMDLFKKLVVKVYAKRFKPKTEFRVEYRGETKKVGDTMMNVRTTVHGKKIAADVDYLFLPSKQGEALEWRVTDIVIDEVSMALNWRTQFGRIIKKQGFDALLDKIKSRVEKKD